VEVAPILNVSDLNASFAWFATLGWEKGWEWCPPGSTGATFGAVTSEGHEIFLCLDGHVIRISAAIPHEHPHE
jgi:hypothetical protein